MTGRQTAATTLRHRVLAPLSSEDNNCRNYTISNNNDLRYQGQRRRLVVNPFVENYCNRNGTRLKPYVNPCDSMLWLTRFAVGVPTGLRCFIKTEGTILHSKIPLCIAMPLAISILISLPAAARAADLSDPFLKSFAAPNRSLETDDRPNVLLIMVDDLNVAIGA